MPSYSPNWNKNVVGTYPEREIDPETGQAEPQLIRLSCSACGDQSQRTCTTGAVRQWVLRYALAHTHKDPLGHAPPRQ